MPNNNSVKDVSTLSVRLTPADAYRRVPIIQSGWECTGFAIPKPDEWYVAYTGASRCSHGNETNNAPRLIVRELRPRRWIVEEIPAEPGKPQNMLNGVYVAVVEEIK